MERLTRADELLKDLKEGVVHDYQIPTLRRLMNVIYGDFNDDDDKNEIERPWPYSLILVLNCDPDLIIEDETLELLAPRVDYVLKYMLTEQEAAVIVRRFKDHLKLSDIGKELDVTKERVRQIEEKALRKLRHPNRLRKINAGINYDAKINELQEKVENKEKELASKLHLLRIKIEKMNTILQEAGYKLKLDTPEDNASIELLNLSIRSYNCLKRAGINTIKELTLKTKEDLKEVRNLGSKGIEEIIEKLEKTGYALKISDKDPDFDPIEIHNNPYIEKN